MVAKFRTSLLRASLPHVVRRFSDDREAEAGDHAAMFDLLVAIVGALRAGFRSRTGLIRIAPRSPWQNGFAERFVGTLRRELLDHVIVLGERHLLHLVRQHARYYNEDQPHMSLCGDAPVARAVEPIGSGRVVALSRVGGLHHRYSSDQRQLLLPVDDNYFCRSAPF